MCDLQNRSNIVNVVEDDPDVRRVIDLTLSSVGYEVRTFENARDYLDRLDDSEPSCTIIDLLLPGMSGLTLCRQLCETPTCSSFVMISGHGDIASAVDVMKLGAIDFLEKPVSRERLLHAVNAGLERARRRFAEESEEREVWKRLQSLTPREREVFDGMADGLVTKQIALQLGISTKTVDVHRSKISQKLCIDSPSQLGKIISIVSRRQRFRQSLK